MARPTVHGALQLIRGMCSDEMPYAAIDEAIAAAIERVKDLEAERDELLPRETAGPDPAAIAHLEQRWDDNVACPYCGGTDWSVGETVQLLTSETVLTPMVLVGCEGCGHTTFVRADKIAPG